MGQEYGVDLLDRRHQVPIREVSVLGASVRFVQSSAGRAPFEGVYSTPHNFLAMYHLADTDVEGRYLCDRDSQFANVGQVVFRPSNFEVEARGSIRDRRVECWVSDERFRSAINNDFAWNADRLERTFNLDASNARALMYRMFQELVRPGMAAETVIDCLLVVILNDLSQNFARAGIARSERVYSHSDALSKVMQRISDCAEVLPTVVELASIASLSERHLLRLFKQVHGHSLCHHIREVRVEKAKHFLSWTDLPLKEIAYRLNFSTHANFTTAFVRETGITPSEFRRSHARSFTFLTS